MMFFGKSRSNMGQSTNVSLPKVVFLKYIFLTSYYMNQTEIECQSYDLGKLMYQLTQNGAHNFGVSSSRVRFLDV